MKTLATVLLVAGLALLLPVFADLALVNAMVLVMIAALFAMGYNLLWGQAGLISFGHATYFALGASVTVMMMDVIDRDGRFPTPLLPLVGAAASFALGIVAGWFATIRTGVYFAMITVAITELVRAIVQRWDSAFGGEAGIASIRTAWGPFDFQTLTDVYYFTLAWTVLGILLLWWIQNSPLGGIVRGIREQEERVQFLGYETHSLKTVVFALSSGVSGLAGALLAFSNESINVSLFEGVNSSTVLLNTVIGGAGVFFGPAIGAALTTLFGYYVANLTHYWLLYLGLLFIAVVVFAPRGLAGVAVDLARRRSEGGHFDLLAYGRRLVGSLAIAVGVVLVTELIGAIASPSYQVGGVAWRSIRVFGIAWSPLSPVTFVVVAGLFIVGILLLRDVGDVARRNARQILGSLSGTEEPRG